MLALPKIIGHRGACAYAPENTLRSFALAADLGCRMVEFDVRLSADGAPVVFHDDRVDRCTDGSGPVAGMSLVELKRLNAGGGEQIPTLVEVLELCLRRDLAVNVEIKPHAGAEYATTRHALEALGRVWPSDHAPPLISSFHPRCLAMAGEMAPFWPRGLLVGRVTQETLRRAEELACEALHVDHRWLSALMIRGVLRAGFAVLAYTVNHPARARGLWRRGVSAVFCDAPDHLSLP